MRGLYRVIHYGPPDTTEEYQQEYGRAGRDGKESEAIILWNKKLLYHASMDIRKYVHNSDQCRRHQLMQLFGAKPCYVPIPHNCCDICAKTCTCNDDKSCRHQGMEVAVVNVRASHSYSDHVRTVSCHQRSRLERLMLGYASSFGHSEELGGFDQEAIQAILNHAEAIFSADNVNQYAMLTESQTDKVLDMFDEVFGDCDRVDKNEDGDDENDLQSGDDDDNLKDKDEDEDEDEDEEDNEDVAN